MNKNEEISKVIPILLMNNKTCKTPQIYFLPKINKGILPPLGRPIVLGNNSPSEKFSTFLDLYLQPVVKTSSSYVKDTGAFVKMIAGMPPLEKGDIIYRQRRCHLAVYQYSER